MKAEGKLNEQPISLMFPGQPSSMLTPPCGGIHQATSASFQPWLEAPPLQPVVRQAQVPCAALAGVQVTLENSDLWTKFYAIGNEMIITRPGRRMFPVMQVRVSGMEHSSYYMLLLDLVPMDNFRYRFLGNCWLPVEPATDSSPDDCVGGDGRPYLHENGPCLGSQWMMRPVNFGAVKLTNQKSNTAQKMMLQSMRKYVPRVHVFAGSDVQQLDYRRFKTFVFPETGFISVTSYQNEQRG
ncbi:T-box transcription factor TBX6 [Dermacentor silvarum]|uniref:T-box transcription factor TBX6 n=1 Tax=Dermacentor silvarum TaxID=543639 RepID=UPI002100CD99|nr:T-box transcription factor TBX6 [Dermacentor silvarum]